MIRMTGFRWLTPGLKLKRWLVVFGYRHVPSRHWRGVNAQLPMAVLRRGLVLADAV